MADIDSPPKKKSRPSLDPEEEDEGFKFTRKSRRAKICYQPKKSATKAVSRSTKKRRSSFVRGRKERKSLPPPAPAEGGIPELYQDIPSGLPPKERLRKLFDLSLELAIAKLSEQPSDTKTKIPGFDKEAKAMFEHLRQVISDSNIIEEAWEQPASENRVILVPNPRNQQLEKDADTCKLASQKLQEEDSTWEQLLHEKQKLEEKTKKELQEYTSSGKNKDEIPDFLSPSQHKLLSGKPDLKNITNNTERLKQTTVIQVDKICEIVSGLKQYNDTTGGYLQQQMGSFGLRSLEVINDLGTPRTLIRGHVTGR